MTELITNRTESDVLYGNGKGVYSYSDLNRVEQAVAEISGFAAQMDIPLNLVTKTDWGTPGTFPESFPTESQMSRYLGNVRAIRDGFGISSWLPQSMRKLTWQGANSIEKVLQAAAKIADQTIPNFRCCGELFAGEE